MYNFIKVKLYRLKTSNNYLKLIKLYHFFFGETFKKKIRIPDFYNNKIHRIDVVNKIIEIKKFNDYLEIGCDQDELFNRVKIRYKTGVDPHSGGTHRMTSDSFFKTNNRLFDLIFIDGLHTYKQVKKDIENSLDCLTEKGFLLLHDCFPLSYYDQAVPRAQRKWNGDTWKAIIDFRTKENLNVFVGAFDNGIGLIYKKKNLNKLILDKEIKKIKYKDYYHNHHDYLNLISYETFFKKIDDFK